MNSKKSKSTAEQEGRRQEAVGGMDGWVGREGGRGRPSELNERERRRGSGAL